MARETDSPSSLACSGTTGELVHVQVLAAFEVDTDAAFQEGAPATLEDAVQVAGRILARRA